MKYCVNCGTLLEDSHEICIGCGADVTEEGSFSLYPPDMADEIEKEHEEKKSRGGLIAAMVAVFILLVAAIAVFIIYNASRMEPIEGMDEDEEYEEYVEDEYVEDEYSEDEEYAEDVNAEPASEEVQPAPDTREVKDSEGRYYNYGTLADSAGNVVFSTIYPEDFIVAASNINYEIYSTKYPVNITYIVGNEDQNVQMTYMSPQHYWYRKSDRGKTRKDERDIYDYMQFLTYNGAEGYIDALIKQSYTDLKGFKLIDKEEFAPEVTEKIAAVSADHTQELTGEIGDYAKIAKDTVYAAMEAEYESYIYHYQATSRHNNTIYMDFYVPVIANKLGYASDMDADKGVVTEWVVPAFFAFEAGNEELYNKYLDAFKLFVYNSKPTEEFMYINKAYSDELESAIASGGSIDALSSEKLSGFHSSYTPGADLGRFGNQMNSFINTNPGICSYFDGDKVIVSGNNSLQAFYSAEKNKVFITPVGDEYPGSEYVDLVYHEPAVSVAPEESSSDESSESSEAAGVS